MTIEDRLALIRAGYTRAEIEEMINAAEPPAPDAIPATDAAPAKDAATAKTQAVTQEPVDEKAPAPVPVNDQEAPAWAVALKKSIDEQTKAMQQYNRRFDEMADAPTAEDAAVAACAAYLGANKK